MLATFFYAELLLPIFDLKKKLSKEDPSLKVKNLEIVPFLGPFQQKIIYIGSFLSEIKLLLCTQYVEGQF